MCVSYICPSVALYIVYTTPFVARLLCTAILPWTVISYSPPLLGWASWGPSSILSHQLLLLTGMERICFPSPHILDRCPSRLGPWPSFFSPSTLNHSVRLSLHIVSLTIAMLMTLNCILFCMYFSPSDSHFIDRISSCLMNISTWMANHHLKLNLVKTEVLFLPAQSSPRFDVSITVDGASVPILLGQEP